MNPNALDADFAKGPAPAVYGNWYPTRLWCKQNNN